MSHSLIAWTVSLILFTGSLVRQLLDELADVVAHKWNDLGRVLLVPVPKLREIEISHGSEGVSRCLTELLKYWIESSSPENPWDDVISALRNLDQNRLADQLETKYSKHGEGKMCLIY